MRDRFVSGTYNAICDECGFKFKATDLRMRWDNFFVCPKCWEPRHPQDYVKGLVDSQRVPIARPDEDRFEQTPVTRDQL